MPVPLVLALAGCTTLLPPDTPTPVSAEPLPGSFYLTSDPSEAPYHVSIRSDSEGGPSSRVAVFEPGDTVIVNWSNLPLPVEKWIEVNGHDCDGTFQIRERFETDLLLDLSGDTCRISVTGMHPESASHHPPQSQVDHPRDISGRTRSAG